MDQAGASTNSGCEKATYQMAKLAGSWSHVKTCILPRPFHKSRLSEGKLCRSRLVIHSHYAILNVGVSYILGDIAARRIGVATCKNRSFKGLLGSQNLY